MSTINFADYQVLPKYSATGGSALAKRLHAAVPESMPDWVKAAAEVMMQAARDLRAVRLAETQQPPSIRRAADLAVDRAWGALSDALSAACTLPEEDFPEGTSASEIRHALFPDGLSFLAMQYVQEWEESDLRLERIEKEGWTARLASIIGSGYLGQIRRAHAVYGEALGMTEARARIPQPARGGKLRVLRKAMSRYVRGVLAMVDEDDDGSVGAALDALLPIDEYRVEINRRGGSVDDDEETDGGAGASTPATLPVPSVAAPAAVTPMAPQV